MECLNCDIRAKENIELHKEIDRLTALLAEKDSQAEGWLNNCNMMETELEKERLNVADKNALLAERNAEIERLKAEIESRNQLRYDALKGEHSRSPYYYDSWCKLHDHKGVIGTSDKPPIHYAVNLLNRLTKQLTASQKECKRLKAEVQSLQYPSYCAREADARKQAARECVEILRFYNGVEGIADQVMKKFGLEG